jgi:hypothetical protein
VLIKKKIVKGDIAFQKIFMASIFYMDANCRIVYDRKARRQENTQQWGIV